MWVKTPRASSNGVPIPMVLCMLGTKYSINNKGIMFIIWSTSHTAVRHSPELIQILSLLIDRCTDSLWTNPQPPHTDCAWGSLYQSRGSALVGCLTVIQTPSLFLGCMVMIDTHAVLHVLECCSVQAMVIICIELLHQYSEMQCNDFITHQHTWYELFCAYQPTLRDATIVLLFNTLCPHYPVTWR